MTRTRVISSVVLAAGLWAGFAAPAFSWMSSGSVEEYVESLNRSELKQALGLASVRRPDGVVNRLDVVFKDTASPEARARGLQTIGRNFLMRLFEETRIPIVSVVERTPSGQILNRAVVTLTTIPQPLVGGRPPCAVAGRSGMQ